MKSKRPVTIHDISRMARVSSATVSRALNAHTHHLVAPETRDRIRTLVEKHSYTPNIAARHLRGSAFRTIGVIIPHFQGVFFSDYYVKVLAGVADVLFESDYTFKLIMPKPGQAKWDRYDFKTGEGVDGLLVTHWSWCFSGLSVLERSAIPCVVINDPKADLRLPFVSGDNVLGGELAARHLYTKGHRNIAVLMGPADSNDAHLRLMGFKKYLRQTDKSVKLTLLPGEFLYERAQSLTKALLKKTRTATAIFCCNDNMALGALSVIRELCLSCPEDISVMGYDDEARAQTAAPPLTTIRVPLYDIATAGAQHLLRYLKKEIPDESFYRQTTFPVELVERNSVGEYR